ncbi:MAG: hypothetical protein IJ544_09420 [Prevotella sp.]|nr:hypothetical protein [Prevotella sp.]
MKKLLTLTIALAGLTTAGAYDYPYLTFQSADGSTTSVSVESLTITINDGQLVVRNADGSQTFTVAQLSKMFFSETAEATGISTAKTDGTSEEVEVYTVGGIAIGKFASMAQAKQTLKPGLYVVRSGNKTTKINIR